MQTANIASNSIWGFRSGSVKSRGEQILSSERIGVCTAVCSVGRRLVWNDCKISGGKTVSRMSIGSGQQEVGHVMRESAEGRKLGAVFFDLDDTLVLTHEADSVAHSAVLELVKENAPQVERSALLRAFIKKFVNQAWDPEHKVEVTEWRARLWGDALAAQGVANMELARKMQSCFDRERLGAFRWTSGVEALVRNLHRHGIKVGIITNGHPLIQRAKIQACKASELFDTILVGGEEPKAKPHKDIFLKACLLAGCKPEESIMVGDTLTTDILGGINTGFLSTVWVNVHKEELPRDGPKPDHVISNFAELEQVLKQLGVSWDESYFDEVYHRT